MEICVVDEKPDSPLMSPGHHHPVQYDSQPGELNSKSHSILKPHSFRPFFFAAKIWLMFGLGMPQILTDQELGQG